MTMPETLALLLAVATLAGLVVGPVLLIRSGCPGLRAMGWALALIVVLFGGLILLTQGSAIAPGDYPFAGPQETFPNGGLEVGQGPVGYKLTA